ncbi:MAG: GH116 family glycosyl hydrolase [Anaerolineaceae bacterium]|nr:GH116 family glycosyl hydrolase [Anaerolineaceae bacterium]
MSNWPFNADAPRHQWTGIQADGFPDPVPGCVYDGHRLDGGIPLGGLGTGYFTLEGKGLIGHCSIFNDIVPPRADFREWLTLRIVGGESLPLSTADIAYWGHHPVADLVCCFESKGLELGIRAFAPLILGDSVDSNIPAVLFEMEIRNSRAEALDLELIVEPPNASGSPTWERGPHDIALAGEDIDVFKNGDELVGRIARRVTANGSARVRFVFAWHSPYWRDSGREPHYNQYSQRYEGAAAAADDALERFDALLNSVLAWQRPVYAAGLPAWLRDGLVQSLYSLSKNTVWIAKTRKDEWWDEIGWFTHNESHTGCPITETMVCRMHGHLPILFFFPELERTSLEAFRHFQIADGEVPFSYGMDTAMRDPRYHCQHPLNPGQYAQMIYRLYLRSGDREHLAHFYDSAVRAIRYQFSLDDDGDGLVNEQSHARLGELSSANQFYDIWPWYGTSAYVAGTWLATLACGQAMATLMKDADFAAECADWLKRGQTAYQDKLWTGEYYRVWHDPANTSGEGTDCDASLGNQLMAQWCTKITGLPDTLPADQVRSALATIERLNMAATAHGLVNGVNPDGTRHVSRPDPAAHPNLLPNNDHARQTFFAENVCGAMNFIYHGQPETGLEIARRLYEAVALTSRTPWKQHCLLDADTGLPVWGEDYYSNMVIWALPMALAGQDIAAFAQGELISAVNAASR